MCLWGLCELLLVFTVAQKKTLYVTADGVHFRVKPYLIIF